MLQFCPSRIDTQKNRETVLQELIFHPDLEYLRMAAKTPILVD